MGQACGYMCNKKEGENNTFFFPDSEQKELSNVPSFAEISNQEFSKAVNRKNKDFLNTAYNSNITSNVDENSKTQEQIKNIFSNKLITFKLIKLQAIIRGRIIRKRIKIQLAKNHIAVLKANYERFNVKKIEEYEAKFPEFKPNSPLSDGYHSFGQDKIYFNKMLLEKDSFYVGEVNMNNEKHGYGRLINDDMTLLQGNWIRNEFTGYGRKIDCKGILYEGY